MWWGRLVALDPWVPKEHKGPKVAVGSRADGESRGLKVSMESQVSRGILDKQDNPASPHTPGATWFPRWPQVSTRSPVSPAW